MLRFILKGGFVRNSFNFVYNLFISWFFIFLFGFGIGISMQSCGSSMKVSSESFFQKRKYLSGVHVNGSFQDQKKKTKSSSKEERNHLSKGTSVPEREGDVNRNSPTSTCQEKGEVSPSKVDGSSEKDPEKVQEPVDKKESPSTNIEGGPEEDLDQLSFLLEGRLYEITLERKEEDLLTDPGENGDNSRESQNVWKAILTGLFSLSFLVGTSFLIAFLIFSGITLLYIGLGALGLHLLLSSFAFQPNRIPVLIALAQLLAFLIYYYNILAILA